MNENVIAKLMREIDLKKAPVVVGLDPDPKNMPEHYADLIKSGDIESIFAYCKEIIDAVSDIVPAVKPNIAFFEAYDMKYYGIGTRVYRDVCNYAKHKGLIVIADAKRGDIMSTSKLYANAYLSSNSQYDFLTVNSYFGSDSLQPFVNACNDNGKGIFVLVKTSNPSSSEIQDLVTADGEKVYEKVGKIVGELGSIDLEYGYRNVGAVVGATHPMDAARLRILMPNTFFLVPGYGAQGATADDIICNFDKDGKGAIVNASRSILAAFKDPKYSKLEFADAARQATIDMILDINNALEKRNK